MTAHDCIEHLDHCQVEWTEPSGEPCSSEWWRCHECGAEYTEAELDAMLAEDEPADPLLIAQVIGVPTLHSRLEAGVLVLEILAKRREAEKDPSIGREVEASLLAWNEAGLMAAEVRG